MSFFSHRQTVKIHLPQDKVVWGQTGIKYKRLFKIYPNWFWGKKKHFIHVNYITWSIMTHANTISALSFLLLQSWQCLLNILESICFIKCSGSELCKWYRGPLFCINKIFGPWINTSEELPAMLLTGTRQNMQSVHHLMILNYLK